MKLSEIAAQPTIAAAMAPKLKLSDVQPPAPTIATVTAPRDPTEGMSGLDKFLAGIGQGANAAGNAIQQFTVNSPALASVVPGLSQSAIASMMDPNYRKAVNYNITETAKIDAPLLDTGAGKGGSVVGQTLASLLAGGGAGGTITKGAGALNSLFQAVRAGATQGAFGAALQPVENVRDRTVTDLVTGDQPADFTAEKLRQLMEGGIGGGVTGGALNGLGAVAKGALNLGRMPFRAAAGKEIVDAAQDFPVATPSRAFIDESEQLARDTGVPLTPGQVTGSKGITAMEQKLRQSPKTADAVFQHDANASQALDHYVSKMLSNTSKSALSPEEAGDLVRTAIRSKVGSLEDARKAQAATDYGAVRSLTKGAATIEPSETNALLKKILSDNEGVGSDSADRVARWARKQLSNVDPKAKAVVEQPSGLVDARGNLLTPPAEAAGKAAATAPAQGNLDKMIELRSYLSKVAGGMKAIGGENDDRRIAAQLLGTIDNDMASAEGVGGAVGDALKKANANFRAHSQQIDAIKKAPLGKLLGEDVVGGAADFNTIAPEKLLARVKSMTPSEVSQTRAMMQDASPEAWQAMKRRVIEDALEQARIAAPSQGANALAMQPGAFVRALKGQTAQGQAWAKAMLEPGELAQLDKAFKVAQRLGDKTGYNFSGTAPALEDGIRELQDVTAHSTMTGMARRAAGAAYSKLTSKTLAAAMVDPNGRKMLLQMRELPESSNRLRQLAAQLAGTFAGDEKTEPGEQGKDGDE